MKSKNFISGTRRKNNYSYDGMNEVGVFKTTQGKYIVKVKQGSKAVTLGEPLDTKKEAIEKFNNYKK